jgi:hypothetical protein
MATEFLVFTELAAADVSKFITYNANLRRLEACLGRVASRTNGGPPGSPAQGAAYIIDSATGAWSSFTVNNIAQYVGAVWVQYTRSEGMSVWVMDQDKRYAYNGTTWVEEAAASTGISAFSDGSILFSVVSSSGAAATIGQDNTNLKFDNSTDTLTTKNITLLSSGTFTNNGITTLNGATTTSALTANGAVIFSNTATFSSTTTHNGAVTNNAATTLSAATASGLITANGGVAFANAATTTSATVTETIQKFYEEGTFTPEVYGSSSAGSGTYNGRTGEYTRIGNVVIFYISYDISAHTGTGNLRVRKLPYSAANNTVVNVFVNNLTFSGTHLQWFIVGDEVWANDVTSGAGDAYIAIDAVHQAIISGYYLI